MPGLRYPYRCSNCRRDSLLTSKHVRLVCYAYYRWLVVAAFGCEHCGDYLPVFCKRAEHVGFLCFNGCELEIKHTTASQALLARYHEAYGCYPAPVSAAERHLFSGQAANVPVKALWD